MRNFTVGPVQSCQEVRRIGGEQVPYFRTPEFSAVMLASEALMKEFTLAPEGSRVVFLTGSGTAAMEAAVMNLFTPADKVLVVDGGGFGHRFVELCRIHRVPHEVIAPESGHGITAADLAPYEGQGFTGFLVNLCETSTGVGYDLDLIRDFCRRNDLFLVADAVSAFLADPIHMEQAGIRALLTGSQKALACPPGVSIMVLDPEAVRRAMENETRCMYLDLKSALVNMERGQTPFTPAVGTLLQIHARLLQIRQNGGVEAETRRIGALAADFRSRIAGLPLDRYCQDPSNCVTALATRNCSAYDIFTVLKDEYGIWICPNGGELKDRVFRVGHLGDLTAEDNRVLAEALADLVKRGILR